MCEAGRAYRISGRAVLGVHELGLFIEEKLLTLVRHGCDCGSHESGYQAGTQQCQGRHEGEQEGVVRGQAQGLLPVSERAIAGAKWQVVSLSVHVRGRWVGDGMCGRVRRMHT